MQLTASQLRQNIYRILDQVLETGVAVEVKRKGGTVKIIPEEQGSRLDNLPPRRYLTCDPQEIVHIDWSDQWRP